MSANVVTGNLIFTPARSRCATAKVEFVGKLGRDMTVEQGYEAAKLCAINVLARSRWRSRPISIGSCGA